MRTTLDLDERLLKAAEVRAAATGKSLDAVVEEALRREMEPVSEPAGEEYPFPTFEGGRLQPGVDINNSAALWDLMDRDPR